MNNEYSVVHCYLVHRSIFVYRQLKATYTRQTSKSLSFLRQLVSQGITEVCVSATSGFQSAFIPHINFLLHYY